jgi:hypothetical protein
MPPFLPPEKAHPEGESKTPDHKATPSDAAEVLIVDTPGGRFRAQFAPELPVSPLGGTGVFHSVLVCDRRFRGTDCGHAALLQQQPRTPPPRRDWNPAFGNALRALSLRSPRGPARRRHCPEPARTEGRSSARIVCAGRWLASVPSRGRTGCAVTSTKPVILNPAIESAADGQRPPAALSIAGFRIKLSAHTKLFGTHFLSRCPPRAWSTLPG